MSKSDQCLYNTAFRRFWELRRDFKSLNRLIYAQNIVRIVGGLKNNLREFFKYANMKRNASGYPSSMFLRNDCALQFYCKFICWGFEAQNHYDRETYRSEILLGVRKNILLEVKKAKISLQSPKTGFGRQSCFFLLKSTSTLRVLACFFLLIPTKLF
jgi:hypothetical protein